MFLSMIRIHSFFNDKLKNDKKKSSNSCEQYDSIIFGDQNMNPTGHRLNPKHDTVDI